jgi:AbrB family looped-hinge helix DNA binding protein
MLKTDALTARVSSKGQIAIPKEVRDRLGLVAGSDVAVRVDGDSVVLTKVRPRSWRKWAGRLRRTPLLADLSAERALERKRDAQRP